MFICFKIIKNNILYFCCLDQGEARKGEHKYIDTVCRKTFTTQSGFSNHRLNKILTEHRLLSIGQFVPITEKALEDLLVGQFLCSMHEDKRFTLRDNALEHTKTRVHLGNNAETIDILFGQNKSNFGQYTCKYDYFKTDTFKFAKTHIVAVHRDHCDLPVGQKRDTYFIENDIYSHIISDATKSFTKQNYNFLCKIDSTTFSQKQILIYHFFTKHKEDFRKAANGTEVLYFDDPLNKRNPKFIEKESAKKVIQLIERIEIRENTTQISKILWKLKRSETEFIDYLIFNKSL